MRYIKQYKIFESDNDYKYHSLNHYFGITYNEVGDIIQEMLDIHEGLTYRVEISLKGDDSHVFNDVDHFIVFIESETAFSDMPYLNMVEEVDSLFKMYGLEIFYVSSVAERSIGMNLFIKREGDHSRVMEKIPEIHVPDSNPYNDNIAGFMESISTIFYSIVDRTKENFDFLSSYFDIKMDLNSYMKNSNIKNIEVRIGDVLIGDCMFVLKENRSVHMNYTFILESYRNKGINQEIKRRVIDWCRKNGYNKVTCNVRESNKESLSSLLKSGFKINSNYDLKYPDGEKKIPLYYIV